MKKNSTLLLFILFICVSLNAQNLTMDWANQIGSVNEEKVKKIVADAQGNTYVIGTFRDVVDFDPSPNSTILQSFGENDIFFAKIDAQGDLTWANRIGGQFDDQVNDIIILKDGNIIIGGNFKGEAEFDPSGKNSTILSVASGEQDGFFAKYSGAGDLIWAKNIGGSIEALSVDKDGNIYTAGVFYGTENFNPTAVTANSTAVGMGDIYFAKYSANGIYAWHFAIGSNNEDILSNLTLDADNNLYLIGSVSAPADFNPASGVAIVTPNNGKAGFIARYSSNFGGFQWVKSFIGTTSNTDCLFSSIAIENKKNPNIYCAGTFQNTIDFNPSSAAANNLVSNGGFDVFLLKLTSTGDYVWAKSIGADQNEKCSSITIDSLSNIYLAGSFLGSIDLDPSAAVKEVVSNGESDMYFSKYDSNGAYVWSHGFGGNRNEEGIYISPASKSVFYIAGLFDSVFDIDPSSNSQKVAPQGEGDFLFGKFNTCGRIESNREIKSCKPIVFNGQTYTKTSNVTSVLKTKEGCDSTHVVTIKIENIATSLKSTACDSFVYNNKTYKQSGNFVDVLKTKDGCDSTFTLALTINKAQKGTLTKKACISYALNGQTYTKSGVYTQSLKTKRGCDSLLTIDLTISNSVENTIEKSACEVYVLNGQTYNSSGTYTQKLKTINGCDSTLTLKLTINKTVNSNLEKTACERYIFNGQTYTTSGTYTSKLSTSKGCDSIVILKLTINSVKATATLNQKTLTASPAGATYQWLDCAKNKAPIANATQQTFAPTVNGTYAVSVTQNDCSAVSDCINLIIIGTNDKDFSNNITIFPNPSNGKYMIKFENTSSLVDVKVSDISGKQLLKKDNVDSNNLVIDISDYENGIYLLNIISDKKEATFKLIKQ